MPVRLIPIITSTFITGGSISADINVDLKAINTPIKPRYAEE